MKSALRVLLAIACFGISGSSLFASVVIEPDRVILHDGKFLPRLANVLPDSKVVQSGETFVLPEDSTWGAIEVQGTLVIPPDRSTTVRFVQILVMPGGRFDATASCGFGVALVVRALPIPNVNQVDPFGLGRGIQSGGHQERVGCAKAAWAEMEDASVGAAALSGVSDTAGWQVGDDLLLPVFQGGPIRVEPQTQVAGGSGGTVLLNRSLSYGHKGVYDFSTRVVKARVANLTRNFVLHSESDDPAFRGHSMHFGAATWNLRYNTHKGLGATQNVPSDNTTLNADGSVAHLGTNRDASYSEHFHGVSGGGANAVRFTKGNVYLAPVDGGKWCFAPHDTSDTVNEENICVGFAGAGFVTEKGQEVRNVFRRTVAYGTKGNGVSADGNARAGCLGCEGAGFWHRGLQNVWDGIESWNNAIGINLFSLHTTSGLVPSAPGGPLDTPIDANSVVPILFQSPRLLGNVQTGYEVWDVMPFDAEDVVAAYSNNQAFSAISGTAHIRLINPTLICAPGVGDGIHSETPYTETMEIINGRIAHCGRGLAGGGGIKLVKFVGTEFQNVRNIVSASRNQPDVGHLEDVTFLPYPGQPFTTIEYGPSTAYPENPIGGVPARHWIITPGSTFGYKLVNVSFGETVFNGWLFQKEQFASSQAWPAVGGTWFACPLPNATMGDCFTQLGHAYAGYAVEDALLIDLPGVLHGKAKAGLDLALPPPRFVPSYPNLLEPASVVTINGKPTIKMRGVLTGDHALADLRGLVSIDGGASFFPKQGQGQWPLEISWNHQTPAHLTPGTHTLRSWRVNANGTPVASSEVVREYFVGSQTDPPPPPDTEVGLCADGIDNDEDGLTDGADPDCQAEPPPSGEGILLTGTPASNSGDVSALFDGNPGTGATLQPLPRFVHLTLSTPARLVRYVIQPQGVAPSAWKVMGYDGVGFKTLDERSGQVFSGSTARSFDVSDPRVFSAYRIVFLAAANGGSAVTLAEVALYGTP